jgi:hypothetical protein
MIRPDEIGTIITGKDVTTYFKLSLVGRLAMQAHGVRFKGASPLAQVQALGGTSKRTAKGAMEDYVLWLYGQGLSLGAMWGTVERTIGAEKTAKLRKKVGDPTK